MQEKRILSVFLVFCLLVWFAPPLTLTAYATDSNYTVTFDSQGGSEIDPVQVTGGTTLNAPDDPAKSGMIFAGWYKEPDCTSKWGFNTDTVISDMTLYAKWADIVLEHNGEKDSFATIQEAVNASVDGDSVMLGEGTFREQVVITKNITLQGEGIDKTVIESPDSGDLEVSGGDWKTLKNTDSIAIIGVKTASEGTVTIKDLTVDGRNQGFLSADKYPDVMAYAFQGIGAYNTNLTVDSVKVTKVRELASDYGYITVPSDYPQDQPSGMNHNENIFAESAEGAGTHTLIVTNSIISKYQKTGILAWGPTLVVDINNNTIQAEKTLWNTGNGIQIASTVFSGGDRRGTSGSITENTIEGIGLVIPEPGEPESYLNLGQSGPTAILLYQAADKFKISGNTIIGQGVPSWHYHNTSENGGYGNDGIGIFFSSESKVKNNTISGFDLGIAEGGAASNTSAIVSENQFSENAIDIWLTSGNDQIELSNEGEVIAYDQTGNGIDTITGFGSGDQITVIGFESNSVSGMIGSDPIYVKDTEGHDAVNGYNDASPVVDFTNGTVEEGDGTLVGMYSVQVDTDGSKTTLYIDTENDEDAPELQIELNGIYKTDNFILDGAYICFSGYIVTFDSQGGSDIDDLEVTYGATITKPDQPDYSGYTFLGWYADSDYTTAWDFDSDTVTGNTTLYAKWKKKTSGGGNRSSSSASTSDKTAEVSVNGVSQNAGSSKDSTNSQGQTVTTMTFDKNKLAEILDNKKEGSTVKVNAAGGSDVITNVLTGEMVKSMENKESILEIQTDAATYILPASEISIDAISKQFGNAISLSDIQVSVEVAESTKSEAKLVEDAASANGFAVQVPAVDFTITCKYKGKSVEVSNFDSYVQRAIVIPDGVDYENITTGVVVKSDGTVYHVPTYIKKIDGVYYAVINSLTNSIYTLVWHPVQFTDVTAAWAKDAVNDMGSRMIVTGVLDDTYEPNRNITRAEFAAIMVRALGLAPGDGNTGFADVASAKWYAGYVKTALEQGIITGYDEETFKPNDNITREQTMTMIARTMKITGLLAAPSEDILKPYSDVAEISSYALESVEKCVLTGVVSGRSDTALSPKANITRAEVAVIVQRLLKKSDLID